MFQVIDDAKEAGENLKTCYSELLSCHTTYDAVDSWQSPAYVFRVSAVFTGGYDHTARCFNAESGECLYVYRGHQSFIFTLKVNVEPQMSKEYADVIESTKWYLYTGSYDGTVKRWDISTGECVRT